MAILLTGVTGVLGSILGPALAQNENEDVYFLVRNGKNNKKLPLIIDPQKVITGDITKPLCGIRSEEIRGLRNKVDKIVHLAANVSFAVNDTDGSIRAVNYMGTKNMLDLAWELRVKDFHHCSTVYTLGRNPYEASKAEAEKLVRSQGFAWNIYRPSAIVGDSKTGYTSDFNGYYGVYGIFHALAQKLRAKELRAFGDVSLPIYVVCSPVSTINLIQMDWIKDTMLKLLNKGAKREIYNVCHPRPPVSRWVYQVGFDVLGIHEVKYLNEPTPITFQDRKLRVIQKAIDEILDRYLPYVTFEEAFSLETTRTALEAEYIDPPEITAEFIYKLLKFAVDNNFGRERTEKNKKEQSGVVLPFHSKAL